MTKKPTKPKEDVLYAFVIQKTANGDHNVLVLDEETHPPTIDDIYAACHIVASNVEIQKHATAVSKAMMHVAKSHDNDKEEKTESGLVVPK